MPVRGVQEVRRNLKALIRHVDEVKIPRTLTEVLIIAEGYSALMTPVDTSNLINSRYRTLDKVRGGWVGRIGYTAAYAAAVHNASGKLKGQPREDWGAGFGGGTGNGNYWDPDAEPEFLRKAFEEDGLSDIKAAITRNMRL